MKKHSLQLLFVVAAACAFLWAVLSGSNPGKDQPTAGTRDEVQTKQTSDTGLTEEAKPEAAITRESPRHAADELEKHRRGNTLTVLNQAVLEQEAKVAEKRQMISTIVRTKGIIYREGDPSVSDKAHVTDRSAEQAQAVQEYAEAKQEFEKELDLLQEMKLKQLGEAIKAQQGGK